MKNLPDGRTIKYVGYPYHANHICIAAPAVNIQRWFPRTNNALAASSRIAMFTIADTGRFVFQLTWAVMGTPLAIDSVLVELYRSQPSGIALPTGLQGVIPPGVSSFGQASAPFDFSQGEGVCVGVLQSGSEAQADWDLSVNLKSYLA